MLLVDLGLGVRGITRDVAGTPVLVVDKAD